MSHYKSYPAYKDSGVEWIGPVPEHWEIKRLRHVATLNPSPNWHDLEQQQPDYPFLPMDAIGETGSLDASGRKDLSDCRNGYIYFADGDVVYAKVTPCFENGKGAVIRGLDGGHGFGTTELTVLRPTAIDRDFLYALTYAESYRQPGASEMLGSGGLKRVPDEFARNYRAAMPPPDEQTAIAAAIDRETARIDALIAKKTRFIELLKEKRQALITHAVTKGLDPKVKMKDSGVEWIVEVPEHWTVTALKRIGDLQAGAGFPDDEQGVLGEEVPFFKVGDMDMPGNQREMLVYQHSVSRSTARRLRAFVFPPGTIDFLKVGAALLLNRRRLLVRPSCIDNNMMGFMYDECDSTWAMYWLAGLDMGRLANPGAVPSVSESRIRDTPVAVPPIDEQRAIAAFLDRETARIDALIGKTQRSIDLLKERRSAFITAAVTGQIDLREAA